MNMVEASIAGPILSWFDQHHRALPWRQNRNIYRVWVSEVMLQQTRVDTVIPYFHRFLGKFPDVSALADAETEDVLKLWEGLGYYARARNLHRAAKQVMKEWDGSIPDTPEQFRRLPGVGPYIAAAVMSIACGYPIPVVDGNVLRIACRIFALGDDIRQPATRKKVAALLEKEIPGETPGNFNEAMMELGSTICTPASPRCGDCPVRNTCLANRKDLVLELPVRTRKAAIPEHRIVVAVITDSSKCFLIQRRPESGLLGGLWEFPGGKVKERETLAAALRRECREELGVEVNIGQEITTIRHAYTHFKILLTAFYCTITGGELRSPLPMRWATMENIATLPFPKANHKIFPALRENKFEVE